MTDPSPAGDTPERSVDVIVAVQLRVTGPFLTDGIQVANRIAVESLGFPTGFPIPFTPIPMRDVEAHGITWATNAVHGFPLASWPTHDGSMPTWTRGGS